MEGTPPVNAKLLDGNATAADIRRGPAELVAKLTATGGRPPGLGTVLVGDDPGSRAYVGGKHRDCAQGGISSIRRHLPPDASQAHPPRCLYRLPPPTPASAPPGRKRRTGTNGPGQGRRRTAPRQPRPAHPGRRGTAAVHPARHRGAAPPPLLTARRSARLCELPGHL